jgi:DNA-binding PadR family transcriptional regulator
MKQKIRHRDLFPASSERMILKGLSSRPMGGYALRQRLKGISALQRTLKKAWLETEMGLSARNHPDRIFKLTEAGWKHLAQELASAEKMFAGVIRILALAGQKEAQ